MLNLSTLGGNISRAYGTNIKRQVVGSSLTSTGLPHTLVWQSGVMNNLGTYGSDNASVAWGIVAQRYRDKPQQLVACWHGLRIRRSLWHQ
ncbi:MAG TPA: hypothetical protein V6C90_02545 [Coleofasciculaceae cyanobacterium]